jgi:cyanophycin synthetase
LATANLGAEAGAMTDELIVKEDANRRGRPSGEIARLVREGAMSAGLPEERITTILPEPEAVAEALRRGQRGDLVLIFADEIAQVWQQIVSFRATAEANTGDSEPRGRGEEA